MTNTIVKTLTDAKTLLIEKGRTTSDLIDRHGCMCALGAIGVATVGEQRLREQGYGIFNTNSESISEEALDAALAVAAELGEEYRVDEEDSYDPVWRFNDSRDTADQDVLAVFDRVIAAQGK